MVAGLRLNTVGSVRGHAVSDEDDSDKTYDPSEKRLSDARRRGEVPRSADLTATAGLAGFVLALMIAGAGAIDSIGSTLAALLERADRLGPTSLSGETSALRPALIELALALAPLFLMPAAVSLAVLFAQRAITFAPEKLMPKASRISPLASAKQKFGRDGLFEFGKSTGKLILTGVLLWKFLSWKLPDMLTSAYLAPAQGALLLVRMLTDFLLLVLALGIAVGGIDMIWQWRAHIRRNRMSRKEMVDEHKEAEGDPHAKSHRRQRAQEIAMNRMIADVPKADVVIVNPTHYAVALRWKRSDRSAPVLLAKGTDAVAARIREAAVLAGVPIHSDPPTARAIHATVDIGAPIAPDQYRAVAAAIRFAETIRAKAKERGLR